MIETILTRKPNIITSIPVDPVSTADAFRHAPAQGVKLVFMDNILAAWKQVHGVDAPPLVKKALQ